MIQLNYLLNPQYKVIFLGCDALISHLLSPLFQFASNSYKLNLIDFISIVDHNRISDNNLLSHRCIEANLGMFTSQHASYVYSGPYPHLKTYYRTDNILSLSVDSLKQLSRVKTNIDKQNVIVVTCTNTNPNVISDLQNIIKLPEKIFNSLTHIHCDIGSTESPGSINVTRTLKDSIEVQHSDEFPVTKYSDSSDMYVQALIGSTAAFEIIANIIKLNTCISDARYFSFKTPYLGYKSEHIPELNYIDLNSDDEYYMLVIGLGGTGSSFISNVAPLISRNSNKFKKIVLADGDILERKNARNQKCLVTEAGNYKVTTIGNRLSKAFPDLKFSYYTNYIYSLTFDDLEKMFNTSLTDKNVIICCFPDNFATRKLPSTLFIEENRFKNLIYLDSGNGTDVREGQTVMGLKAKDTILSDCIGTHSFFKESLWNDTEDIKVIGTCAAATSETPQNAATNLQASTCSAIKFANFLQHDRVVSNCCLFDAHKSLIYYI